jgi:hypothetical protein
LDAVAVLIAVLILLQCGAAATAFDTAIARLRGGTT